MKLKTNKMRKRLIIVGFATRVFLVGTGDFFGVTGASSKSYSA
ncbi:hypothetical protein [Enterococcus sp. AZ163]